MPKYEQYKKAKTDATMQQFYRDEEDAGIMRVPQQVSEFSYEAGQIKERLEKRFESDEDFQIRTQYYFQDEEYAQAKIERYKQVEKSDLSGFAMVHKNHGARKRKRSAGQAKDYYQDMASKMSKYKNDDTDDSIDSYKKFQHKEEIMNLRLKGMLAGCEVKSRSKVQEAFLKNRAKLSCYLALKDQLSHIIEEEQNQKIKKKLMDKLVSVQKSIDKVDEDLKKNTPKATDLWREYNGIDAGYIQNDTTYDDFHFGWMKKDTKMFLRGAEVISYQNRAEWPAKIVLKDSNGAPITLGERLNAEYNATFEQAQRSNDQKALDKIELDGIKRLEALELPKPEQLQKGRTMKYVMENFRDYYDLTKRALPYYRSIVGVPGVAYDYIKSHPEFLRRLVYISAVDEYIDFMLRRDHLIVYGDDRKFKPEVDFRYTPEEKYSYYDKEETQLKEIKYVQSQKYGDDMADLADFQLLNAYKQFTTNYTPKLTELVEQSTINVRIDAYQREAEREKLRKAAESSQRGESTTTTTTTSSHSINDPDDSDDSDDDE